jgi:hypothetical protein
MGFSFSVRQPALRGRSFATTRDTLQRCGGRSCTPGGCAHEDPDELQRRTAGEGRSIDQRVAPAMVQRAVDEPGVPLEAGSRGVMQQYLGHDLGGVRVHTGSRAAASARAVDALAYTVGQDVVFGEGQYQPATPTGGQLLAHELTHVLQQQNTPEKPSLAPSSALDADDAAEREAQRMGAEAPSTVGGGTTDAPERVLGADPLVFRQGQNRSHAPLRSSDLRHDVSHVIQRQVDPTPQRQAVGDATRMSITPAWAAGLSDEELPRQARLVLAQLSALPPTSPAYSSVYQNLVILLHEVQKRPSLQARGGGGSYWRGMLPRLTEWHAAGLLDPPYRPPDVPGFPPFPVTAEQAAGISPAAPIAAGMLAPMPGLPGGGIGPSMPPGGFAPPPPPGPPVQVLWEVPPPVAGPGAGAAVETGAALETGAAVETGAALETGAVVETGAAFETGVGVGAALPVAAFLVVMLWSSETAPAWRDAINEVTNEPYASPEEYQWTNRLTPEQGDYLRHLERARQEKPDPAVEEDPAPWEVPDVELRPDEKEDKKRRRKCVSRQIRRRGGHARHDAYATKITGKVTDFYVETPASLGIAYDGQGRAGGVDVWEVKVKYGFFHNAAYAGLRDLTLRRFDAQRALGVSVAAICGYFHLWSIPDKWIARDLNTRWGGYPPVLSIPE